ncbi:hypothetical protein CD798_01710 [Bacillaceae bacterium SAOS 7]|nr:hypothetical protein CD798_01710 [Bacillaceae bacterium SAOS 7]
MIEIVLLIIAFILIIPLLPWLPLKLNWKGKVIFVFLALISAGALLVSQPFIPLWQSGLLAFGFVAFVTVLFHGYIYRQERFLPVADLVKVDATKAFISAGQPVDEIEEASITPLRAEKQIDEEQTIAESASSASLVSEEEELDVIESLWETSEGEIEVQALDDLVVDEEEAVRPNASVKSTEDDYYLEDLFEELPLISEDTKQKGR